MMSITISNGFGLSTKKANLNFKKINQNYRNKNDFLNFVSKECIKLLLSIRVARNVQL